jgi:hypothetical protein
MATYIEPLNLRYLLVNTLSGSSYIFFGLFIIFLCILAGKFKLPTPPFVILLALSSLIMYNWFGGGFYILVVIISGLLAFWSISKLAK